MKGSRGDELPEPVLTPSLHLVEKWAAHRGDRTSRGWGLFGPGRPETVIRIHHGAVPIYVRDLGKCLMVLGILDLPREVRDRLEETSPADRAEFLDALQDELMACPRVGFSIAPSEARGVAGLERVALDQTLQVAENDPASFNRFCDAIQETETILLRVSELLRRFAVRPQEQAGYTSSTQPPTELYL